MLCQRLDVSFTAVTVSTHLRTSMHSLCNLSSPRQRLSTFWRSIHIWVARDCSSLSLLGPPWSDRALRISRTCASVLRCRLVLESFVPLQCRETGPRRVRTFFLFESMTRRAEAIERASSYAADVRTSATYHILSRKRSCCVIAGSRYPVLSCVIDSSALAHDSQASDRACARLTD